MTKVYHVQHHVGRYAIELNIGLDNNPYRDVPAEKRVQAMAHVIHHLFGHQGLALVPDTCVLMKAVDAGQSEATDIFSFNVYVPYHMAHDADMIESRINVAVDQLCRTTDQEAIAGTYYDAGARDEGSMTRGQFLFGPKASKWGPFDPLFYQAYDKAIATSWAARF